jgi:hypothetical protein
MRPHLLALSLMLLVSLSAAYGQDDPKGASTPLPTPAVTSSLTKLKRALAAEVGVDFDRKSNRVKLDLELSEFKPTLSKKASDKSISSAIQSKIPIETITHFEFEPIKPGECYVSADNSDASDCAKRACELVSRVGDKSLRLFIVKWDDQGLDDFVHNSVGIVVVNHTGSAALTAYCTWMTHET